jgi:hypothetical protein
MAVAPDELYRVSADQFDIGCSDFGGDRGFLDGPLAGVFVDAACAGAIKSHFRVREGKLVAIAPGEKNFGRAQGLDLSGARCHDQFLCARFEFYWLLSVAST